MYPDDAFPDDDLYDAPAAPLPYVARRKKLILTPAQLHHLLGLHDDVRVVTLTSTVDPASVSIVLESHHFNELGDGEEAPIVRLYDRLHRDSNELIGAGSCQSVRR